MGAMKVLAILLSCGAVVFSQNRGDIVKNDFGDFSSRFVGPSPPITGGSSNNLEIQQKGVSPNGNFFAPGVQVLPDPAPFFRPASNVGPIGNAGGLFPMENIGGPSFDNIGGPNNFDNERGPFSFGGDLPFIPDEGFGNVGPEHNGPGPFGPGPFGPGPLGAGPLGPGPIGRGDFGPGPMGPVNIGPGHIGHRNMGPSYPSRIGTEFKHDDFVTDQVNNFRSSPIVRDSSSSRDSVADEAKRFRSSPVVSLLPSGSGNGGSEALNNIAQAIQPTREIDGKRYEPMFKEFPDIFLSNEGKDSCFAKLKKVFDKSYPKLPEVERSNDPISYPHPRLAFKLPPFVNPIYRYAINNNVQYVPYKISTSPAPIFVPFTRDSNKLLFPTLPIFLPYVKISINVPEQKRQYFPYIPFQPDKDRIPSQSCSQSRILLPIPGNPKELYSVAAYTLVALQGNQASGAVIAPSNKNIPGLIGPFLGAGSPVQAAPTFPVVPAVIAGPSIKSGGPVIFSAPLGGSLLPGAGGSFGAAGSLDLDSDFKYSSIASSSGGPAVFSAPLAAASSLLGAGGPAIFSAPLAAAGSLHGAGDPSVAIGGAGHGASGRLAKY